jgi:hypothetical protein
MPCAKIANTVLAGPGRSPLRLATKGGVDDHHERIVVGEQNGILLSKLQLNFLLDLAPCVGPIDVVEVTLYAAKAPADGVIEGEA